MARLRLLTTLAIIAGSSSSSTLFAQCEVHEDAKLTALDVAPEDHFGESVSISGNIALVAAEFDDDNGTNSGSAYVFRWNGSSWVQEQKLLASDGEQGDNFGKSVSVSGNVALVAVLGRIRLALPRPLWPAARDDAEILLRSQIVGCLSLVTLQPSHPRAPPL